MASGAGSKCRSWRTRAIAARCPIRASDTTQSTAVDAVREVPISLLARAAGGSSSTPVRRARSMVMELAPPRTGAFGSASPRPSDARSPSRRTPNAGRHPLIVRGRGSLVVLSPGLPRPWREMSLGLNMVRALDAAWVGTVEASEPAAVVESRARLICPARRWPSRCARPGGGHRPRRQGGDP